MQHLLFVDTLELFRLLDSSVTKACVKLQCLFHMPHLRMLDGVEITSEEKVKGRHYGPADDMWALGTVLGELAPMTPTSAHSPAGLWAAQDKVPKDLACGPDATAAKGCQMTAQWGFRGGSAEN